MVPALSSALKAAFLAVLLACAWSMPASAHAGHGAPSIAAKAKNPVAADDGAASVANAERGEANACAAAQTQAPQPVRAKDRICCGTMCTVAMTEGAVAPMPAPMVRSARIGVPPVGFPPVCTPSLLPRPPRTACIA